MSDFRIGDHVIFNNDHLHDRLPWCNPVAGTKGTVLRADDSLLSTNHNDLLVQWEHGSTSQDDRWWCLSKDVLKCISEK